jgi:hypothetical protein
MNILDYVAITAIFITLTIATSYIEPDPVNELINNPIKIDNKR